MRKQAAWTLSGGIPRVGHAEGEWGGEITSTNEHCILGSQPILDGRAAADPGQDGSWIDQSLHPVQS